MGRDGGYAGDDGCDGGLAAVTGGQGLGVSRAVLDRDVAAEALGGTGAVVVAEDLGDVLDFALALLGFGLKR